MPKSKQTFYKTGVFVGKFFPPHKGHLKAILECSTKCEKLYVVLSHSLEQEQHLCKQNHFDFISPIERLKWLSIELKEFKQIELLILDETKLKIKPYPHGWEPWSESLKKLIPSRIDVLFTGDASNLQEGYLQYFPNTDYVVHKRYFHLSATKLRTSKNILKLWDYILDAAKPYFAKKILITGTESTGKTTLTNLLSKTFNTSCAYEEGRYYSSYHLGGNDLVYQSEDFLNICWEQRKWDQIALEKANKICIFDTDAVVTQFYCEMYLGRQNPRIEAMIDVNRYDYIFMLKPDVEWVSDEVRFLGASDKRQELHDKLKQMYIARGFAKKIIEIGGSYNDRLNIASKIINEIISGKR